MTEFLEISNLQVKFGTNEVIKDVTFALARGESLAIIGSSGSGKSVLIKTILGLVEAANGTISIDGTNILQCPPKQRAEFTKNMSMLFQYSALFDSMTIWENIAFRLIYQMNMPKKQAREQALDFLDQVGLPAQNADLYPAQLSGGMRKRVALARCVAGNPNFLFFDEPTAGLDPIMGRVIDGLIIDQVHKLGATAITITHDMAEVHRIAHRVAMLHNGVFVWQGLASEMGECGNPQVQQFINP